MKVKAKSKQHFPRQTESPDVKPTVSKSPPVNAKKKEHNRNIYLKTAMNNSTTSCTSNIIVAEAEVPEVMGAEIVLNTRGKPTRSKRPNSKFDEFYCPSVANRRKKSDKSHVKQEEANMDKHPDPDIENQSSFNEQSILSIQKDNSIQTPPHPQPLNAYTSGMKRKRTDNSKKKDVPISNISNSKAEKDPPPPPSVPFPSLSFNPVEIPSGSSADAGEGEWMYELPAEDVKQEVNNTSFEPKTSSRGTKTLQSATIPEFSVNVQQVRLDLPMIKQIDMNKKQCNRRNATRIRNLLRLPKAYRWVCSEWFYSDIDRALFFGENDFKRCMNEVFPTLKVEKLTRKEWCFVRQKMGRPRRFSEEYLVVEREFLYRQRDLIRQIQRRKPLPDLRDKNLPREVPMHYVIGTKVTASINIRNSQNSFYEGLYTGTVEGVDLSNNTYRISFDREHIGSLSVVDYQVLADTPPDTIIVPTAPMALSDKFKRVVGSLKRQELESKLEGVVPYAFPVDFILGGFPIRLLETIVRLKKTIVIKSNNIQRFKELNVKAEKMYSYNERYSSDFVLTYARQISTLDKLNSALSIYKNGIHAYFKDMAIESDLSLDSKFFALKNLNSSCYEEAVGLNTFLSQHSCARIEPKIRKMIIEITTLLLQLKEFASVDRDNYAFETQGVKDSLVRMKTSLEGKNLQFFENKVEIPVTRILAGFFTKVLNPTSEK